MSTPWLLNSSRQLHVRRSHAIFLDFHTYLISSLKTVIHIIFYLIYYLIQRKTQIQHVKRYNMCSYYLFHQGCLILIIVWFISIKKSYFFNILCSIGSLPTTCSKLIQGLHQHSTFFKTCSTLKTGYFGQDLPGLRKQTCPRISLFTKAYFTCCISLKFYCNTSSYTNIYLVDKACSTPAVRVLLTFFYMKACVVQ